MYKTMKQTRKSRRGVIAFAITAVLILSAELFTSCDSDDTDIPEQGYFGLDYSMETAKKVVMGSWKCDSVYVRYDSPDVKGWVRDTITNLDEYISIPNDTTYIDMKNGVKTTRKIKSWEMCGLRLNWVSDRAVRSSLSLLLSDGDVINFDEFMYAHNDLLLYVYDDTVYGGSITWDGQKRIGRKTTCFRKIGTE
jgi:hypothetical protein